MHATICCVFWSKMTYSPGAALPKLSMRLLAVSTFCTASTQIKLPSFCFLMTSTKSIRMTPLSGSPARFLGCLKVLFPLLTHSRHVARLVWLVRRATLVELSPRRHRSAHNAPARREVSSTSIQSAALSPVQNSFLGSRGPPRMPISANALCLRRAGWRGKLGGKPGALASVSRHQLDTRSEGRDGHEESG